MLRSQMTIAGLVVSLMLCNRRLPALLSPLSRVRENTAKIERLTGAQGSFDETEAVFKVSVPGKSRRFKDEGHSVVSVPQRVLKHRFREFLV